MDTVQACFFQSWLGFRVSHAVKESQAPATTLSGNIIPSLLWGTIIWSCILLQQGDKSLTVVICPWQLMSWSKGQLWHKRSTLWWWRQRLSDGLCIREDQRFKQATSNWGRNLEQTTSILQKESILLSPEPLVSTSWDFQAVHFYCWGHSTGGLSFQQPSQTGLGTAVFWTVISRKSLYFVKWDLSV